MKERCIMRRRQDLQKACHLRRQSVIYFIPRRPERIAPSLRQCMNLQHRIVRGNTLEADIGMPPNGRKTARVAELMCKAAAFFLLFATDNADLVT